MQDRVQENEDLTVLSKRKLAALQTRERIYNTAVRLFSEYGFDKVTISDIAEEAQLSKGAFYVYFSSKDSILLEVFSHIDQQYAKTWAQFTPELSAADRILALMHAMCLYCSEEFGLQSMQVVYSNQCICGKDPRFLSDKDRGIYSMLEQLYREGTFRGEISSAFSTEEFIIFIMRSARALLYDWCLSDGAFSLPEEGGRYFRHIVDMLLPEEKNEYDP